MESTQPNKALARGSQASASDTTPLRSDLQALGGDAPLATHIVCLCLENESFIHDSHFVQLINIIKRIPRSSTASFIIVYPLSKNVEPVLHNMLSLATGREVRLCTDTCHVTQGSIYLSPPNCNTYVYGGRFVLEPLLLGGQTPLDSLLSCLSHESADRTLVILFPDVKNISQEGIRAIQKKGGVIVQATEADHSGFFEKSTLKSASGPQVLPSFPFSELPALVDRVVCQESSAYLSEEHRTNTAEWQRLHKVMRADLDFDLRRFLQRSVFLACSRVMKSAGITCVDELVQKAPECRSTLEEIKYQLLSSSDRTVLSSVDLKKLCSLALQKMSEQKSPSASKNEMGAASSKSSKADKAIEAPKDRKIWFVGCDAGSFSVEFLASLFGVAEKTPLEANYRVYATDANPKKIHDASKLRLDDARLSSLKPSVANQIRNSILFLKHNALDDHKYVSIDLIVCGDFVSKLTIEARKKLFQSFAFSLKKGGLIHFNTKENFEECKPAFVSVDQSLHLFQASLIGAARNRLFVSSESDLKSHTEARIQQRIKHKKEVSDIDHQLVEHELLQKFMPATLVCKRNGEVVYCYGDLDKFIRLKTGSAMRFVSDYFSEELAYEIELGMRTLYSKDYPLNSLKMQATYSKEEKGESEGEVELGFRKLESKDGSEQLYAVTLG